eukprot:scaffold202323_cov25-Tisochrysis_lutea.AAC.2
MTCLRLSRTALPLQNDLDHLVSQDHHLARWGHLARQDHPTSNRTGSSRPGSSQPGPKQKVGRMIKGGNGGTIHQQQKARLHVPTKVGIAGQRKRALAARNWLRSICLGLRGLIWSFARAIQRGIKAVDSGTLESPLSHCKTPLLLTSIFVVFMLSATARGP